VPSPFAMQTMRRRLPVTLVLLLVLALVAPAGADTVSGAQRRRQEALLKRARLAAHLNALRASDRQLKNAVRDLDATIVVQQSRAVSARRAAQAANVALARAEVKLKATEREAERRRQQVVDRAIHVYVTPGGGSLAGLSGARNLAETARGKLLLERVTNDDASVLDRLRAVRQDLERQREALVRTREETAARRRLAEARLIALQKAKRDQARLRGALARRIQEYLAEADAVAREEESLARYIREYERTLQGSKVVQPIEDSGPASATGLIWPLRGRITSEYGQRWGRPHRGIDIANRSGTPIKAAKAGLVIRVGCGGGYGNCLIIAHGKGLSTLYAHQSRLAVGRGAIVKQGQVIGFVGSTGHSTGPHLHFETRINGSPQNPRRYLP
jgi:murein DD-endopeptidase MepM/ murein hydrolase activator NlpD